MDELFNKEINNKNTEFVYNDPSNGKLVLSTLEKQLSTCDKFQISVAFITEEGIVPFYQLLKELEDKNISGQILTTNYLTFSDPKALDKLNSFKNIELKMFDVNKANLGFHTKAYIFEKNNKYEILIGSSNLTEKALKINKEWNIKISTDTNLELQNEIISEFDKMWNSEYSFSYDEVRSTYKMLYEYNVSTRKQAEEQGFNKEAQLVPNVMQRSFIENLKGIYNSGKDKALLISATGTGKTYASAFGMQALGFKKVLFVVHRFQIAKQAKESYERIFGNSRTFGLIGNGHYETNADYIFATIQTLSKDNYLYNLDKDNFECVILDEAHHSSANMFQKIIEYFKPKLWLGMTATPDRRDSNKKGKNIYEIFDYQIAYEIRLQQAMEEDLLCPFHYFGISDIKVENHEDEDIEFKELTSNERVRHILNQSEYYGYSGDRVKGLIFASRIKECKELSNKFNALGYNTKVVDGSMSEDERQDAFDRLAMDRKEATSDKKPLDYLFSVDVLNEGVDIVEVNQVIMLRPTESPIVFIQQLGRGLRKAKDKKHVIVLDFISNYKKNNYMIPIALSGDRSYNKDNIRRYMLEGNCLIPGISTIHFDEISKQRIFESIDNTNFSEINFIKNSYQELKDMLGRIPTINDFEEYGRMDIQNIFDNGSLGSYYKFLVKYEKEYTIRFNNIQEQFIEFISKKLSKGKRAFELQIIKILLDFNSDDVFSDYEKIYNYKINGYLKRSIINILTNQFPTGTGKDTYKDSIFLEEHNNKYVISDIFKESLKDKNFKDAVYELIVYGLKRNKEKYSNLYLDSQFVLYEKYTYEDVCRLSNFEKNLSSIMNGYYFQKEVNTFPIFINYDKENNITDTTKYEDRFINNSEFIAISKSKRHIDSEDVQSLLNADKNNTKLDLFVRKNKNDKQNSKEFYYLGRLHPNGFSKEFIMANTKISAVEIGYRLQTPVRDDILDYLESDIEIKNENS